ncbi:MAG: hypothetical protein ACP5ME_15090 [Anaerolineae bacterium]
MEPWEAREVFEKVVYEGPGGESPERILEAARVLVDRAASRGSEAAWRDIGDAWRLLRKAGHPVKDIRNARDQTQAIAWVREAIEGRPPQACIERTMRVRVIRFVVPFNKWLNSTVTLDQRGHKLIAVRGHSGRSSWPVAVIIAPAGVVQEDSRYRVSVQPGIYRLEVGNDRRGVPLLRFHPDREEGGERFRLISVDGEVKALPSSAEVLLSGGGSSRTGQSGFYWSVVIFKQKGHLRVRHYDGQFETVSV